MTRTTTIILLAVGTLMASKPALAQKLNADDVKWINQCIDDNKAGPAPT